MKTAPTLLRDRAFYRAFAQLAGTLILEQAVILSVNLLDNVMIGSYSEAALSGVASVNQIQFVVQQLVYGIANGLIVLTSQYWGKGQTGPIRRLAALGFWLETALAVLLFTLASAIPVQLVTLFVKDEAVIAEGVRYLSIIRFTYPVFAVTTLLLGAMRSVETVDLALRVSVVSLAVNFCINFVLISGRFGAPALGAVGAAIGTLTARVIECIIVCVYVLRRDTKLRLTLRDLFRLDRQLSADFLRTDLPVFLQCALWGILNAVQSAILGNMSTSAITAYSISSTAFLLLKVASVGTCTAASILVGKQIGSGDRKRLRDMVVTMQLLFVAIGLCLGLIMFLIRRPLLSLYSIAPETYRLADAFFLIQSVILVTMSYQMPVNAGILRGGGDNRYTLLLDLISSCVIVIPLSYLGAFRWGLSPVAVVMLLNADQVFKGIPSGIRVNRFQWVHELTRPEQ